MCGEDDDTTGGPPPVVVLIEADDGTGIRGEGRHDAGPSSSRLSVESRGGIRRGVVLPSPFSPLPRAPRSPLNGTVEDGEREDESGGFDKGAITEGNHSGGGEDDDDDGGEKDGV